MLTTLSSEFKNPFRHDTSGNCTVALTTYKRSAPIQVWPSVEIDCSGLRDPMGQPQWKDLSGLNKAVQEWMAEDPHVKNVIRHIAMMVEDAIPKKRMLWLNIGLVDTHGRWISPAIAELASQYLTKRCYNHTVKHLSLGV